MNNISNADQKLTMTKFNSFITFVSVTLVFLTQNLIHAQTEINYNNLLFSNNANVSWSDNSDTRYNILSLAGDDHFYINSPEDLIIRYRPTLNDLSESMRVRANGDVVLAGQLKGKRVVTFREFKKVIYNCCTHNAGDHIYKENSYVTSNNVIKFRSIDKDLRALATIDDIPRGATITKAHIYYLDNDDDADEDIAVSFGGSNIFTSEGASPNFKAEIVDLSIVVHDEFDITVTARDSDEVGLRAIVLEYE